MSTNNIFTELIQSHERSWGTEEYSARPSLTDLLQRPVVVFWTGEDKANKGRFTISVHDRVEELNDILLNMILASKVTASSSRRLSRIFVKQKAVKIKGLHLTFVESES
ncbi:MAG: hypothetical protein ABI947_00925 [Chloroflexota bacterium]